MRGWATIRMADPIFKRSPTQSVSSVSPSVVRFSPNLPPREPRVWQLLPPADRRRDSVPYRHWPIYGVVEDSSLDADTLPGDFTWQSHIYRNELHLHSTS